MRQTWSWERSTHSASLVMLKMFKASLQRINDRDTSGCEQQRERKDRDGGRLTQMWSDNRPDVYANRFDTPRVSPARASEWWGGGRSAPLSPTAQQMSTFNPPLNGDGAEGSTARWKWRPFSQREKEVHIQLPGGNPEPSLLPNVERQIPPPYGTLYSAFRCHRAYCTTAKLAVTERERA